MTEWLYKARGGKKALGPPGSSHFVRRGGKKIFQNEGELGQSGKNEKSPPHWRGSFFILVPLYNLLHLMDQMIQDMEPNH